MESAIIAYLKLVNGATSAEIAAATKIPRVEINKCLYSGKISDAVTATVDTPPRWKLLDWDVMAREEPSASEDYIRIIFIDLGNIHSILKRFEPYANNTTIRVYAFADWVYNGYGVNPPPKNPDIIVDRSTTTHKNAADVALIWKLAEIVLTVKSPMKIFIFTKDLGFQAIRDIAQSYSNVLDVKFVIDWDEVRDEVE